MAKPLTRSQEAKTYHVIDFDPTTVKCMIDYMYAGKYGQTPPGSCGDNKDQAQTIEDNKKQCGKSKSEVWIYHGLVNCIADFFGVPELAKMATSILDGLAQNDWSEDAFCSLLYGTLGRTTDEGFRTMLVTRAVDHLGELTARGLFNGDDPSDELTPTILRRCAQRLDAQAKNRKAVASFLSADCPADNYHMCSFMQSTESTESTYQIHCGECGQTSERC
ncbi:hypothetical protein F4679DRAFT_596487 [Xylaria curta]|nr:hypothetical protein F4679DRAFT_596487 [Xylaria curta]